MTARRLGKRGSATPPARADGGAASPEDAALLARVRQGEEPAFVELARRYGPALRRIARTFSEDPALADEIVQETWLAVLTGLDAFEGRATFRTWIFHILANRGRSIAARDKRTVPFSALATGELDAPRPDEERFSENQMWRDPPTPWGANPEERLATQECVQLLHQAIDSLPGAQRAVLVLRDLEGLASHEVCNVLELSESNQRVLLHRARVRLRQALEGFLGR